MKTKLLPRLVCAFLSVLMMACMLPAITVGAADGEEQQEGSTTTDLTRVEYESVEARLAAMQKVYDNGDYSLFCDEVVGVVAYRKNATGEVLFTNPWDMNKEVSKVENIRNQEMSQIILTYVDGKDNSKTLNSFKDAVLKNQISVKSIKNGVRVEYSIGETSARILVPMRIEAESFRKNILEPLAENMPGGAASRDYAVFNAYFSLKKYATAVNEGSAEAIAKAYPICKDKNIDIYVYNSTPTTRELRKLEAMILAYCPEYSFEQMDIDYEYVEYEEEATSPPVFRMALEYTIGSEGLSVTLPANGLRYDETAYRITDFKVLPFMGACYNQNEGYTFVPDGSGALYKLNTPVTLTGRVYGEDYALSTKVSGLHNETMRMPVFGQVETEQLTSGQKISRGFVGIIEEGESLASIAPNHTTMRYASVVPSFVTRQADVARNTSWSIYASRRYTGDYRLRYIILSDDTKARAASLDSYYECSWLGMACAYRDYLDRTSETFNRLTDEDVKSSIPLYIETFGCLDTIKKVLSVPVTVSVALTSFDDIQEMYNYLSGQGVTNVNFKLKGYANGGLYSDVPEKLKWQSSAGGKSGFKDLLEYAKEKDFGIYPDFDFVYTTVSNGGVNMKKNASRTIDNRYTSKRVYAATQQTLVSYYQMVLSPSVYSHYYEKVAKKYGKYKDATGISLSTFGSALNSDFNEDDTVLREESKEIVMTALSYFKNKNYDVMVDGGNAFTWSYVDHILGVPLDSSRYTSSLSAVPFMGVVLHGYVQFAGSPLNMEGDLTYAMLKAMENGASAYFVLSYANTELLKEDELLSQNYSVRYDIWQSRLVDIYKELNAVLADVQTRVIIDHQFLNGTRVPDQDELLEDIAAEAQKQTEELEAKLNTESANALIVKQAWHVTSEYVNTVNSEGARLRAIRYAVTPTGNSLLTAWQDASSDLAGGSDVTDAHLMALVQALSADYVEPLSRINRAMGDLDKQLTAAKKAFDDLVANSNSPEIIAEARNKLSAIIDAYASIYSSYYSQNYTITAAQKDAFIDGNANSGRALREKMTVTGTDLQVDAVDLSDYLFANNATVNARYAKIGLAALGQAVVNQLAADGLYNAADTQNSVVNISGMLTTAMSKLTVIPVVNPQAETGTQTGAEVSSRYSVDSNISLVTYGEVGAPYKSLILNFNDYIVTTEVNNVVYTIGAYDYVVLYY